MSSVLGSAAFVPTINTTTNDKKMKVAASKLKHLSTYLFRLWFPTSLRIGSDQESSHRSKSCPRFLLNIIDLFLSFLIESRANQVSGRVIQQRQRVSPYVGGCFDIKQDGKKSQPLSDHFKNSWVRDDSLEESSALRKVGSVVARSCGARDRKIFSHPKNRRFSQGENF